MPTDTKEQTKDYIAALLEEKRGAEAQARLGRRRGLRAAASSASRAIEAELARVGYEAKAPAKRAEKRPAADEGKASR